jgi:hypothetical protein
LIVWCALSLPSSYNPLTDRAVAQLCCGRSGIILQSELSCSLLIANTKINVRRQVILEQLSRPAERRCPIARASNEIVELLSEHWMIFAPACQPSLIRCKARSLVNVSSSDSTSTTYQPFFLNFYRVHALATHFFLRMWNESGSAAGDFSRIVALTRSQYV